MGNEGRVGWLFFTEGGKGRAKDGGREGTTSVVIGNRCVSE